MRKVLRKILSLCIALGCTFGTGVVVSCAPLGQGNSSSSSSALTYAVSCTTTDGVQVNVPSRVEAGETVRINVQLESGYYLRKIIVNGQELTSASFVMPDYDVTVEVYAANGDTAYSVSATQQTGGEIMPAVTQAKRGETVTATVQAQKGYRLQKIYANGVELSYTETDDFCYTVKALMQDTELVFSADFAPNPVLNSDYGYMLATTSTSASYWQARYLDEGIYFSILVQDENVVQNGRLGVEERDFIELRICEKSEEQALENANALRCLVTADGTFYLQKCLGADDYAPSGLGVNYEYGENFRTETLLCTKAKNRFDGYAVEIFLGYDLFGLTKDEALGNMTFIPAVNNTLYTDGKKGTGGIVYASADTQFSNKDVDAFYADEYKCQRNNPATYLGIAQDGGIYGRAVASYASADYLFLGDDTFASARWTAFAKNIVGAKAYNIGAKNATATTYTSQTALDFADTLQPETIVFAVGNGDLISGASASTTASRIVEMLKAYHELLPQANLVWNALNEQTVNESVKAFASSVGYVTVIEHSNFEELTAEEYDTYIAKIASALALVTPLSGSSFGNAKYGNSSIGWTVDTQTGELQLTCREDDGKKYAYCADFSSTQLLASATFSAGDVYNGDETPSFGLVLASEREKLYFYVTETYVEGELMQKRIGYTLYKDDEITATGTLEPSLYYRDGESVTLSLEKTQDGVDLYVSGYKAFSLTGIGIFAESTETSVGVYSENMQITVKNATVTDKNTAGEA